MFFVDFMVYSTNEFKEKVDLFLRNASQYIYFNSARVYANSDNFITENSHRLLDSSVDSTFLSTDDYALSKARQENILLSSKQKNYTIVRPYITYGEDRLQIGIQEHETWLRRALNGKHIIIQKEIADKYTTLTYSGDVANAVCALIGKKEAFGQIYHITALTYLKWSEILDIYSNVLGNKVHIHLQVKYITKDKSLDRYQAKYDRMFTRKFDNTKISSFIDAKNFIEPTLGLKHCLEDFLDHPIYKNLPFKWKDEAVMDQIGRDFSPLNEIPGCKNKIIYLYFRYVPCQLIDILRFIKNLIK